MKTLVNVTPVQTRSLADASTACCDWLDWEITLKSLQWVRNEIGGPK